MKNRRIYMLKVGEREAPSINHLYLEENAPPRLLTCMYFWCVVDETGPVVIDQGFSAQTLKDLNIPFRFEAEPTELLRRIGIDVQDVRTVILTHLHWDHYSGEEFFPRATYFVQQREMDFVVNPLIRYRALGRFYNPAALEKIVLLHRAGSSSSTETGIFFQASPRSGPAGIPREVRGWSWKPGKAVRSSAAM